MVLVKHLISPASLPSPLPPTPVVVPTSTTATTTTQVEEQLSILSYNILLPNSSDGWWTYKMYMPPLSDTDEEQQEYVATWEYRRDLIKNRLSLINADIVCFQEVSPTSFTDDFDFMVELGYDQHELFKKGRFRPATFWKSTSCTLALPAVHKDRCLLTAFQINNNIDNNIDNNEEDNDNTKKHNQQQQTQTDNSSSTQNNNNNNNDYWYVCNCHLQAGKQGGRRVRQIHEAMRGIITMGRKIKARNLESPKLIVCGDFNGGSECGAIRYLEDGYIDETFLEDNEQVSSGRKELPLNKPLVDTMTTVNRNKETTITTTTTTTTTTSDDDNNNNNEQQQSESEPPPTLVVPELMSIMMMEATYDNPIMSQTLNDTLKRIYSKLATNPNKQMSFDDVQNWLIKINKQYGRGDEYREAAKQMGYVLDDDDDDDESSTKNKKDLSYDEKKKRIKIPENGILTLEGFIEIYQKELMNGKFWGIAHDLAVLGDPLPNAGVFTARYDRMYHNSNSIQPIAVLDTISKQPCPNIEEPSDHLPIAATFVCVKNN